MSPTQSGSFSRKRPTYSTRKSEHDKRRTQLKQEPNTSLYFFPIQSLEHVRLRLIRFTKCMLKTNYTLLVGIFFAALFLFFSFNVYSSSLVVSQKEKKPQN